MLLPALSSPETFSFIPCVHEIPICLIMRAGLGGCGEVCGPLVLLVLAGAAVVGLVVAVPASLRFLYEQVDKATGRTVAMVRASMCVCLCVSCLCDYAQHLYQPGQ